MRRQNENEKQGAKRNSKKRKQVFPYGNYTSYYGYRIGQCVDEDPRLKVLRKEWFEGKECHHPDCLPDRVEDEYWNLRKAVRLKIGGNKPAVFQT